MMPETNISAFPDRPVYRAASQYEKIYPYTQALGSALFTPGNRVDRFNAGAEGLANGLGYQTTARLYAKGLKKLYETHPGLAEQVNRHPILLGGPAILLGVVLSSGAGSLSRRLMQRLLSGEGVQKARDGVLYSGAGDKLAKALTPLGRFAQKPVVKFAVGGGFLLFGLAFLFRVLQDSTSFSRAYRQARKQERKELKGQTEAQPLSPYAMKNQVALDRRFPQFTPALPPQVGESSAQG